MISNKNAKNLILYFSEIIACFLVVFIHKPFPGVFGVYIEGIARISVPFFFTVSGYFLFKDEADIKTLRHRIFKKAFRIAIIFLISELIYFLFNVVNESLSNSISTYFQQTFTWKRLLNLFVINNPLISGHNWFLIALLFSYIIIALFLPLLFKHRKLFYILSILVIFVPVFRITSSLLKLNIFGIDLSYPYTTWFTTGIPFISLGVLLKDKSSFLLKFNSKKCFLLILLFIMVVLSGLEFVLWSKIIKLEVVFCNIFAIPLVFAVSNMFNGNLKLLNWLKVKGNFPMYVYIVHPLLISLYKIILNNLSKNEEVCLQWISPFIILIVSIALAYLFNYLVVIIKERKFKKLA